MAYQNTGTPRFYIDYISYMKAKGLASLTSDTSGFPVNFPYGLNPAKVNPLTQFQQQGENLYLLFMGATFTDNSFPIDTSNQYFAVLGHNANTCDDNSVAIGLKLHDEGGDQLTVEPVTSYHINSNGATDINSYDGFTLGTYDIGESHSVDEINKVEFRFESPTDDTGEEILSVPFYANSLVWGSYYDMTHSPDLSITLAHEYGGVKSKESFGGSTLSNQMWYKPPEWGNLEAWQLSGFNQISSGRRTWSLSFSYMSDSSLEPRNLTGQDTSGNLNDSNWFQTVLQYTMGGYLPFIFAPDKDATWNPDNYDIPELAICKFDMNTFSRKQVANNVYNINVKVREVW